MGALVPFDFRGISSSGSSNLRLLPIKTWHITTFEIHGLVYEAGIQPPTPQLHTGGEQDTQHHVRTDASPTPRWLWLIAQAKRHKSKPSSPFPSKLIPAEVPCHTYMEMGEGCGSGLSLYFCRKPMGR